MKLSSSGARPILDAEPRSIPSQIAEEIAVRIVRGDFVVGEKLNEQALADQFSVSRGPVRDALKLLERRGMVRNHARRGAFVEMPSVALIADAFNVRVVLTGMAAWTLAARADVEDVRRLSDAVDLIAGLADEIGADPVAFAEAAATFARLMVELGGNRFLDALMDDLTEQIAFTLVRRYPLDYLTAERRREQVELMRDIVSAVKARDPERAERHTRQAWVRWRNAALRELANAAGEPLPENKLIAFS